MDQLSPIIEAFFTKRGFVYTSLNASMGRNDLSFRFKVLEVAENNPLMGIAFLQVGQVAYATLRGKPSKIVISAYPRTSSGKYQAKDLDTGISWRIPKSSLRLTAREVGYDDTDRSKMSPLEVVQKGFAAIGTVVYCEGETKVLCVKITEIDVVNRTYEVVDTNGMYYDVAFVDCYLKAKDVPKS